MKRRIFWFFVILLILMAVFFLFPKVFGSTVRYPEKEEVKEEDKKSILGGIFGDGGEKETIKPFDTELYDKKMEALANNPPPPPPVTKNVKDPQTGELTTVIEPPKTTPNLWPVKTVYPNPGAILPFKRIVAYYGNLYSTKMGVLGQYPEDQMLEKLRSEVKKWEAVDPETPVMPALHYIAVVAQGSAGKDGKYRARMPGTEIDKVLAMAEKINAIVFLDIQVGFSNLQAEVPVFEKYLKMQNVHLGIDAEFSMKGKHPPGKVVGTFNAADINYTISYLSKLVKENNLPPKVLVIHRYTKNMITGYKEIKPTPEVQVVMHMDGWGGGAKKFGTYRNFIYPEPVQFTGFKLFYKNDTLEPGSTLLTPSEVLTLRPKPIYIQYQ